MKILIIVFLLPLALFGQTEHMVRPNIADPMSGEPNNYHYCYTNQTLPQKNKLFLFFPGTYAVPFNYREILKHAANLGYHAIGLTYPNSIAINQICLSTTDTTCHSRARLEVFDGIDRHIDIDVDVNNCIERRTLKLLEYLNTNYPSENWGQYYSGSQIQWNNVIVSGHSQGGGHAGIISKINEVERVVMFAAMDWITLFNRNADWITWNGPTPDDKYFGFTHENDESVDFTKLQTTWDNYGMNSFGDLVLVDTSFIPYNNSHKLYTLLTPANDTTKFHGSVVADAYTPFNAGVPVYAPVWTYLIEGNVLSSIYADQKLEELTIYPNPTNDIIYIQIPMSTEQFEIALYSVIGENILRSINIQSLDISEFPNGIYFMTVKQNDKIWTTKIIKN